MEAIQVTQFGGPEVLIPTSLPTPTLGADHQVLVQIQAAGVNPVDTYIRAGTYSRLPTLPYIPGLDGAGQVVAVGVGVTHLAVGDRVYGGWPITGTCAQFSLYDSQWLYPLPPEICFEAGACIFVPYSTAYRALFDQGQAQPGETVLIHGATGAVGLAAVQLAVAAGLRVIGTGGSATGRDLLLSQGAALALDHHSQDYGQEIKAATEGRGVDVVVEMLANVNLGLDLTLLAAGGRVVVVGSRGKVEITPRDLMARQSRILGLNLFETPAAALHRIHKALYAGLKNGSLAPVVRQSLPLAQAAQAHEQVLMSPAQGNWILLP